MKAIAHARDPFGYDVKVENFCELDGVQKDISYFKNNIVKVIEQPGMMIEVFDTSLKRYYFGAVTWNQTILVGVRNKNGTWSVTKCFENPSASLVTPIFLRGNQLI
ncbi:hypothetical protein [Niastella populi]|uniref:Uncharacterized protein n=1 Tax=Niastella populi TaxID=550983 RepID=A0A1V9EJS6_9BACT|nr:hypothetical protein [Niastella populi]OQP46418.1 hypothetical protein A4R26_31965 [Niastella populi]